VSKPTNLGKIAWTDLTVPDAEGLRDFYSRVVGWSSDPVSMGEYSDFNMLPSGSNEPVAGICHAQGVNADLPPVWLLYIVVEDLEKSLAACREGGGEILVGPKGMGPGSAYAVIRDPAGAVSALYQVGS
jgi:predicted enzyme related to lactoylglutathione lyase